MREAAAFEESSKYLEAYQNYSQLAETFKGLRDTADAERKVSQLTCSRELKAAVREEQDEIRKQRDLERQLLSLIARRERLSLQDTRVTEGSDRSLTGGGISEGNDQDFDAGNRLAALLRDLQKRSKATQDSGERRVARRTLEGLFVAFFEQGYSLLQTQARYAEATKHFRITTELNPDRAGAFFYLAVAYAANGDKKRSLRALESAIDRGFSNLAAVLNNKAFESIRSDSQYQKIIERLKNK
jgi:tetratricopeptide (TPR) repeat protein